METIYEFIEETNELSKSGKKLNLYKCKICGHFFLKRESHIKKIKICKHFLKKHNPQGLSKTRIYNIYKAMISRCYNKNNKDYKNYGGRGIAIYNEWLNDFLEFYDWTMANGYKEGLTIDRINVNGNYEPNNCRWITTSQNSKFKRTTKLITINGKINSCNGWAKELKKSKNYISKMLKTKGIEYTKNYIKENM